MTNLESLIFYVVLFSISTYFIFLSNRTKQKTKKNVFVIIGLAIPILISELRYDVGTDFDTYVAMYDSIEGFSTSNVELLFLVISKMAMFLGNIQYMFAIYSALTIIFVYKSLEYNKNKYSLSLTFFLYLFLHFAISLNIIRQALAVAIVFFSYRYLVEKNFNKFIFWILIASISHITALIFLPMYFIVPKDEEKLGKFQRIQVIAIIIIMFVVFNFNELLQYITNFSMFDKYIVYTNEVSGQKKSLILKLLLLCVFLCFRKQLIAYEGKNNIYIIIFIIGVILEFTGLFSAFIKRIAMYFSISEIYLISCSPKIFKKKDRNIVLLAIIFYAITIFIIAFYIKGQSDIIPYKTILMNH